MPKKFIILILPAFGYLLLFPQTALLWARDGLLLWYRQVLPVIFPFMFLSTLAVRTVKISDLPAILTRPLMKIFHCSAYGAFVILSGFLCGFPIGAFLTADLYRTGKISRREARLLLGFANNLSPGFILSYLSAQQMQLPQEGGWFLFQILGAALLKGWIDARKINHPTIKAADMDAKNGISAAPSNLFALIDSCIYDAMSNVLRLGAYIMLFSILTGAVQKAVLLSNPVIRLLTSGIEVTTGIHMIAESGLSATAKYISVSALGAFGGLSALAQSAGIAGMDRNTFLYYIKSRVKITLLAIGLSCAVLWARSWIFFPMSQ
ncbi:MAG: hypothetical protein LUI87_09755 [Lachnospiraceae bacterium]|nr:hypothetical protein [Lachnospiraceae bacterium]